MTTIKTCTCIHKYQDQKYGNGKRVHNQMKGGRSGKPGWRCTVCSAQKQATG